MTRQVKLNEEQVWVIRNDAHHMSLPNYAKEFNVSYQTVYKAKRGLGTYANKEFSRDFENVMQEKYFAAA